MQRSERFRNLATRSRFRIGAFWVQPDSLTLSQEGREIALEPRVMEVLVALAEHAGEVVSSEQLLIEVWRGTFYGDNPVHKAVAFLRKAFDDDLKSPRYIQTIRKRGYRLIANVAYPDDYRRVAQNVTEWSGACPFVGLASFDGAHAGVFFGRSRVTAELLAAMRQQIDNQRRFILIVGPSGCGKTSLLNAGLLPLLRQDGGFDGLRTLSVAHCDLAAIEPGEALANLAASLSTWALGDRPIYPPGMRPAQYAEVIRQAPESLTAGIEEALHRYASRELALSPYAHLLLVIDHAEALVAMRAQRAEADVGFSRALNHLCESPRVMVVMVVRADFYLDLVQTYPEIAERKLGEGHFDVLTPRAGEIAQIIRIPASLAGLTFEADSQTAEHLDDVLRDAAISQSDALPLLQHTLQALYERRDSDDVLRFDAYREIGGLEGALAHRAEQVFAALEDSAKQSLGRVFLKLIVMQFDNDLVTARRVLWSQIDDDARELAEAFVRGRLFVAELSDGLPSFRVTHEALLRQWPRARDWTQNNRHLLQSRARLRRAAARWAEENHSADQLLNPGRPLQEALEAARQLPDDLSSNEQSFLSASARLDRRRRWLRRAAVSSLAMLAVISAAFALIATRARNEAEQRREEALQLSDFMLVELAEKLRPLGNLKLLSSISTEALAQLESRPEALTRNEDLINRSRALRTVGEVLMSEAKLSDAQAAFERALAAAKSAVERSPESVDAIAELGVAAYWLGYYHYRHVQLDQAQVHWTTYLQTSERLLALDSKSAAWQIELSYALNNLGAIARDRGSIDQALAYFSRSATLKAAVLHEQPDDYSLRYDLVDTLSWISSGDASQGRLQQASKGYAEQVAMLRTLVANRPDALLWSRRLATSLLSSADLSVELGKVDSAGKQIDESILLLKKLTGLQPENKVWRLDLALAHLEAGEVAYLEANREIQAAHARFATTLIDEVRKSGDASLAARRLAAAAMVANAQSQSGGSDRAWGAAVAALEDIARSTEQKPIDLFVLAKALISRGRQLWGQGRGQEARAYWEWAISVLDTVSKNSTDTNALVPWVSAHVLLGKQQLVGVEIDRLKKMGYRAPDFTDILFQSQTENPKTIIFSRSELP